MHLDRRSTDPLHAKSFTYRHKHICSRFQGLFFCKSHKLPGLVNTKRAADESQYTLEQWPAGSVLSGVRDYILK